jgi:3-deoxy-7-phosphoheptulonate synthase
MHPNPDLAKCDGPESLTFDNFDKLMHQVKDVARAVGKVPAGAL